MAEDWVDFEEWRSLNAKSAKLLDQADYYRHRKQYDKAKQVWAELTPLNIRLRSIKVRGLDIEQRKLAIFADRGLEIREKNDG